MTTEQRDSRRTPLAGGQTSVTLMLTHPDGKISTHRVRPYNISSKGAGFLHDEAIPVQTFCRFLITFKGEKLRVTGRVARCDPAEGDKFNIGVAVALVELEEPAEAGEPGRTAGAELVRESF